MFKRLRLGCLTGFVALGCFVAAQEPAPPQKAEPCIPDVLQEFDAKVIGISDGDTLRVLKDDREAVSVRLEGIDAPEKAQEHGAKAKAALDALVGSKVVTIKQTGTDKYRRTLALVYVDKECVNEKLVEQGWAWHYKQYNCDERLAKLEVEARAAKRGLWDHDRPMPPWEFRHLGERKAVVSKEVPITPSPPVPVVKPTATANGITPAEKKLWLNTGSNVRHNAGCKHFANTNKGRFCGPNDGKACGICGG